jgi:S-DNA-T family DNA segregation ATPase FtsK/SpoIIIE
VTGVSGPGTEVTLRAVPDPDPDGLAPATPDPPPVVYDTRRVPGERLPVIPPNWRSRQEIRATLALAGSQQWHRARFHGLRLPLHVVVVLWCALTGLVRLAAVHLHWWWVLEQHGLRSQAVVDGDERAWMRLHKEAKETRKTRGAVLMFEALALAAAVVALLRLTPRWAQVTAGAVALLVLARVGRPDRPVIPAAIVPPQYQAPTHDMITDALGSLGIKAINDVIKDGRGLAWVSPVMQDGPGWGVQLDLPRGVTAEKIRSMRPELSSALRRPLSATWPEGVPEEHDGRLNLWVGFHDITKAKPPKWPLAKAGQADVFAGLPFGTDPRQRNVTAPMFEVNWLIGASPGQGKTGSVRVLCCGVALDPLADLSIHELAGKGDLEPLAQVCHRYCSGLDDDSIAYAAESAALLRRELERRSKLFSNVPKHLRPEGKVTRELAQQVKGLRPRVEVWDEAQNMFMHPEHGAQAADDLAYVMRLGRALGIIVILATQRPDKDSLPTAIRGIVTCRFCLKVPDYDSNDMILGTGAYKAGYNAAIFRAKTDAGLGWLKGDGDPQVCRTYYLDLPAAERIAARARAMRERAGVLTGYAAGLEDGATPRDVLADLLSVFATDSGMQWATAAERLAERFPDRWADATAEGVSAQCRAVGVRSVDVRADGQVLKGCRRVAAEKAMAER